MEDRYNDDFFEKETDSEYETNNVIEYDITASPRDLTPASIVDMVDSGIIEIPLFQRNYIWDIKKASKLIESLILGLPVPELFFYSEGDENSRYKIIDGQQRLLSIYFFLKGRFPRNQDSRILLGKEINSGCELERFLSDNKYFTDFALQLNSEKDGIKSRYNGLKYLNLDKDTQIKLRLRRYLRTVVVRQNKPDNNSSSMFEIFNRLNTGGAALNNQEIRASLYYCDFYKMISELNDYDAWRNLLGKPVKDLHSNDIELILRVLALLVDGDKYAPKMASFLNVFSQRSKSFDSDFIKFLKDIFIAFVESCKNLEDKAFFRNGRFSKPFFESVFCAVCEDSYKNHTVNIKHINASSFNALKCDAKFIDNMQAGSSSSDSITNRRNRAKELLSYEER